ncbi:MAG: FAD-dependent protein [Planctomycetota bacterium]
MSVLLRNLSVSIAKDQSALPGIITRQLRLRRGDLAAWKIVRRSLDSRSGRKPRYQYTVALDLAPDIEERLLTAKRPRVEAYTPAMPLQPQRLPASSPATPVVVGAGPAGVFAAYRLAQGGARPIVLERGPEVTERSKRWFAFLKGGPFDPDCNLLFGEGGAGAYSDGKLYTRVRDPRVQEVLDLLVAAGAPAEIAYAAKPHIGSNLLPAIVRNFRKQLIELGVEFRFDTLLTNLQIEDAPGHAGSERRLVGAEVAEQPALATDALFLGIGHSARDTYHMLHDRGVALENKPFQMGVRIEHSQEYIDRVQYGSAAGDPNLPPAEYQWVIRRDGGDVFSFCMCPGGEILPATERAGYICVNGASRFKRIGDFANSGFVVTVEPPTESVGAQPLLALERQAEVERRAAQLTGQPFAAPALRLGDFLAGEVSTSLPPSSYPLATVPVPFDEFLPRNVYESVRDGLQRLAQRKSGFLEDAIVLGPEARSSSPVRIVRGSDFQSTNTHGLYPIGEGAGYAGGIMSAAIDGMQAAEAWLAVQARKP